MKKLILFFMIIAVAFTGFFARANTMQNQDFVNKSMELLMENPAALNYKNKSLSVNDNQRLFKHITDFLVELLFSGQDDKLENPTGPVKDFNASCNTISEQSLVARCELLIHYKDTSSASIGFLVQIGGSRLPEKIVENTIDINIIQL
jgi:hypothetical protein